MPMSRYARLTIVFLSFAPLLSSQSKLAHAEQAATTQSRPATWAAPVAIAGVPNLHRVAPNFYRSAQPEASGFQALAKDPGIKTVVSLRAFNSDERPAAGTGIKLVRIKIHTWHIETEDVVKALSEVRKAEATGPVLLHCQHGADRTGLVTALYRLLYQSWTKDAALDEMQHGSFGYHAMWGNIPRYLKAVNVEALKQLVEKAP
jgi:protein tyrosine/serine phosphatase